MIQRIQSIYLLVASILMALTFVLPFGQKNDFNLTATHNIGLMAVAGISIAFNLFIIFQFNDRKKQMMLANIALLIPVIFYGLAHVVANQDNIVAVSFDKMNYGFPLAGLAMLFIFLAKNAIQKDHKLVNSTDRLR